ncbi:MAG: CHAD domain-containing protein [Planctomycetota bacterium]
MQPLLTQPLHAAIRHVALTQLAQAQAACARLANDTDTEALHAFRVAIRRLRSTLRAWKKPLHGAIKPKHRKRLRRLQRATGGARDAEVALAWVQKQADLDPAHAPGAAWFVEGLQRRLAREQRQARRKLLRALEQIRTDMEERLDDRAAAQDATAGPEDKDFAAALANRVQKGGRAWLEALTRLRGSRDEDRSHATRILGKRLRYLLDPATNLPEVEALKKRLRSFQNVLGKVNDTRVLRAAVTRARRSHGKGKRTEREGLEELLRRLAAREQGLFERVDRRTAEERLAEASTLLAAAVDALKAASGSASAGG